MSNPTTEFDPGLTSLLIDHGIDPELTHMVLRRINTRKASTGQHEHLTVPSPDDPRILDTGQLQCFTCDSDRVAAAASLYNIPEPLISRGETDGVSYVFDRTTLRYIGLYLLPLVSYGVLNGGSATSYVDIKKNRGFNETVYSVYEKRFLNLAPSMKNAPKGLTPGFFNLDIIPGPSFLELKMRALLVARAARDRLFGDEFHAGPETLYPMYQMTNARNDSIVAEAYDTYRESPYLAPLIDQTGIDITRVTTGVQPLIAALTHSDEGPNRTVFLNERNEPIPLPGGHGQCFAALRNVFQKLHEAGMHFVQIGNVDNMGNTVDEMCIAIMALSGSAAGFDFSKRTPVDVKGGVLVCDESGRLTCADIGPAMSFETVLRAEKENRPVLFNCATGLFNLATLVESLDWIITELPIRLSDQDKDAGRYSQAEQITWEVIGLLDDPLIFAVNKYDRFLAAKLLVENLLTSGISLDSELLVRGDDATRRIRSVAMYLHGGLVKKLVGTYGLEYAATGWRPNS